MNSKTLLKTIHIENFIEIGERIINNANDPNELDSIMEVSKLSSLDSFLLGVSVIMFGIDSNPKGCDNLLDKTISVVNSLDTPNEYLN